MNTAFETPVRFVVRPLAGDDSATAASSAAVLHVVCSRSDAVRLAPVMVALRARGIPQSLAYTLGEDVAELDVVDAAGLPLTQRLVDPTTGSPSERTARGLAAFEHMLLEHRPAMVVLAGDADATLACGLAASKLGVPIARLGGGLRCHDWSLSEEINRTLVDRLADVLLVDSWEAADALKSEGIDADRVHCIGSTVADSVLRWREPARRRRPVDGLGLTPREYVLVTLHRPENIEDDFRLRQIVSGIEALAERVPIVFPIHPRTAAVMAPMGDVDRLRAAGVIVTDPLDYLDFLALEDFAGAILTDSGCVQEEASALGVRCYTLRRTTERSATLRHGTNVLLGENASDIVSVRCETLDAVAAIPFWDGNSGEHAASVLARWLSPAEAA